VQARPLSEFGLCFGNIWDSACTVNGAFPPLQGCLRFRQNRTHRHQGCCREVVPSVGMNADPNGQRKKGQNNRRAKLDRSPIGQPAGHIELEGQEHQNQHKHGRAKAHHGRHLTRSFFIRVTPPAQ
jgi:hypothetical protein